MKAFAADQYCTVYFHIAFCGGCGKGERVELNDRTHETLAMRNIKETGATSRMKEDLVSD